MNRITPDALYELLPAVHRLRDAAEGEPLRALIAVLVREGAVIEENIEQLLDDLFIETCADWVIPYLADLLGTSHLSGEPRALRADVSHTVRNRRRKGTLKSIESLTSDVTQWVVYSVAYCAMTDSQ